MTDQRPSNAPDAAPEPNDADTAAAVLSDDDATPGGGGLGGADAGDPLRRSGGASPNAPLAEADPAGATDPAHDAARTAVDDVPEPHPSSR